MMPSRTQRASRLASPVAGHAPNCPQNGLMQNRQRAHVQARHCRRASDAVMAKFRPPRGARAGRRKIVVVLHALVEKKRWALAVVKRKMGSLRPLRVDALHTAAVLVRVTEAAMPVVAMRAAVQDLAIRTQAPVPGGLDPRVARHAAAAAMAEIRHLPVARATVEVVVVTTAVAALAAAVLATPAVVVVATTEAARVAVKTAAMVVATKAVQAQARRARAGVIAASRRQMDAAVAAQAAAMAVAPQGATAIVVAAASQATVGQRPLAAVSALAAAQATAMA